MPGLWYDTSFYLCEQRQFSGSVFLASSMDMGTYWPNLVWSCSKNVKARGITQEMANNHYIDHACADLFDKNAANVPSHSANGF